MQIFEAFCEEIGKVLDIYGAREVYFQQPVAERHRLTFRCSDAECRVSLNPKVSGVNYDKVVEESETYVQPHFKSIAQHPHQGDCMWMAQEVRLRSERLPQRGTRVTKAKATNVIDVFMPRTQDSVIAQTQTMRPKSSDTLTNDLNEQNDTGAGSMGLSRTSRLEKFIDCWSTMEFKKRMENKVALAGMSVSYAYAVLNPKRLRPSESGMRVLQGLVKANFWPKTKPTMLYLNFEDKCAMFEAINASHDLVIAIPLQRFYRYSGSGLMKQRIEDGSKPGYYLKAYCWGEISASPKQGFELKLEALDNLVIKAVQKKSKPVIEPRSE